MSSAGKGKSKAERLVERTLSRVAAVADVSAPTDAEVARLLALEVSEYAWMDGFWFAPQEAQVHCDDERAFIPRS
jgi:hypothetical protein